jgi:adenine-specific DNA-methyltransferase
MNATMQKSPTYDALKKQLEEMFQLDRGDLDFGLYRVMNMKREEVITFLERDLLPQVRAILETVKAPDAEALANEWKAIQANPSKFAPDYVEEVRQKVSQAPDVEALEQDVYSHLTNFFKRYYADGDFMSLRRYKEGVYAMPYQGEEVKLHWANHDQYYIKTSENLKNYTFKLPNSEHRVRFEVVAGSTETNNNKGKERRFVLHTPNPVEVTEEAVTIRFEYRAFEEKRDQKDHNQESHDALLALADLQPYADALRTLAPTEKQKDRTLLAKHLADFTAKHSFDYFIHKDLGAFLRRELDFFIKNEIMHLDDIENDTAPRLEAYLGKIKALRKVAHKIIDFLAQLEDFQKRLWNKKKFVLEAHYCLTIDHLLTHEQSDAWLAEIAHNDAQRAEWVRWLAIDELPDYSTPLTLDFLKANDKLPVDTRFFSRALKYAWLGTLAHVEEQTQGVLINSENYQALNLLQARYREQVKCIYIDPPYNTGNDGFIYKDTLKHSTWLSFMHDRLQLGRNLLNEAGVQFSSIDENEVNNLSSLYEIQGNSLISQITVKSNPGGRDYGGIALTHEYLLCHSKNENQELFLIFDKDKKFKYKDDLGEFDDRELRNRNIKFNNFNRPNLHYPFYVNEQLLDSNGFHEVSLDYHNDWVEVFPLESQGVKTVWRWGKEKVLENLNINVKGKRKQDGTFMIIEKYRSSYKRERSIFDEKDIRTEHGSLTLKSLFEKLESFTYPKSDKLLEKVVLLGSESTDLILDYFAGSGTTGHAVLNLNRQDGGNRKYILVEMGAYFDSVTKPRLLKVAYSKDWKNGKPVSRDGVSHVFKTLTLEQYEDSLDNLIFKPKNDTQQSLLEQYKDFREGYLLNYWLNAETQGSPSLLNTQAFEDPFAYTLRITRNDDTQTVAVDLVETFNYLLGLRVEAYSFHEKDGILEVQGVNAHGERCLILWRNTVRITSDAFDEWFQKRYSTKDFEFDAIYVNGDNHLENYKKAEDLWKVRLIETEFHRLMFESCDV